MSVNLKRFVEVNIQRVSEQSPISTRDTVVLFAGSAATAGTYSSYDAVPSTDATVKHYAKRYFENGGVKLRVINKTVSVDTVKELSNKEIVIASTANDITTEIANQFSEKQPDPAEGALPNDKKIFLTHTSGTDADFLNTVNVATKHGDAGVEMTIAAYLSRINADVEGSARDYCFTIETIDDVNASKYASGNADVSTDDATVGACINGNLNIDTILSGEVRNVGGNLTCGRDIVNEFMMIVLEQMTEEAVTATLVEKIKGEKGCAAIYNAVAVELKRFVKNGSIAAGNWINSDWVATYNGENYEIMTKNERLSQGYKIVVVPYAMQSAEDAQLHKATPVYVAITNAYGIRKIVIEGQVI